MDHFLSAKKLRTAEAYKKEKVQTKGDLMAEGTSGGSVHKSAEVHMEEGNIATTLLWFTLPVLVSQILQQLYSMADCMIVGRFGGDGSLAAAGEAALLLSVIINFFVGFSTGVSAISGKYFGARQYEKLQALMKFVVLVSLAVGIILTIPGIFMAGQLLVWLNCPTDVLVQATGYLQVSLLGMTAQLIYNMGNALLRSLGNTKQPLYYLLGSCVLNLVLDVLFVVVLPWGLLGAAAATVLSQWVLAGMIVIRLCRMEPEYRLQLRGQTENFRDAGYIIKTGLPSGMQAIFMSISSLVIQLSINAFGAQAAAGMVVFARVEGFLYYPAFCYGMALTGFIGQNYGAGKMDRVEDAMKISVRTACAFMLPFSLLLAAVSPWILWLFTGDPAILKEGQSAVMHIFPFYVLYAINQVYIGGLRGLGHTGCPMVCSMICYCFFRVTWCQMLLPFFWDMRVIYTSYDVSWIIMIVLLVWKYKHAYRHDCEVLWGLLQGKKEQKARTIA